MAELVDDSDTLCLRVEFLDPKEQYSGSLELVMSRSDFAHQILDPAILVTADRDLHLLDSGAGGPQAETSGSAILLVEVRREDFQVSVPLRLGPADQERLLRAVAEL